MAGFGDGQGRFARDTAVQRVAAGRYHGRIDPGWAVLQGGVPNGGYVMALAARAMRAELAHPDPVTLTAHFLTAPEPGEVEVRVEVIRRGGRHSSVAARLLQSGRERTRLLGTFTDLTTAEGPTRMEAKPPELPPITACVDATRLALERSEQSGFPPSPIMQRFEHRVPEALTGWTEGAPVGRSEMGGYVRWADGAPMDTLGVLAVADCYPPAVFNASRSLLGWVPTIELTVQLRKRPAPGHLATWLSTRAVTRGYLEEDAEIWDAEGELVALSRQLALVPRR